MPSRVEIVSFDDSPPSGGADSWVAGAAPAAGIEVTGPDPDWPRHYDELASRIRKALGWRVLQLDHVGSTSVQGLAAKPVIDIDLTVADPGPRAGLRTGAGGDRVPAGDPGAVVVRPQGAAGGRASLQPSRLRVRQP
jgi:hypothetical protein